MGYFVVCDLEVRSAPGHLNISSTYLSPDASRDMLRYFDSISSVTWRNWYDARSSGTTGRETTAVAFCVLVSTSHPACYWMQLQHLVTGLFVFRARCLGADHLIDVRRCIERQYQVQNFDRQSRHIYVPPHMFRTYPRRKEACTRLGYVSNVCPLATTSWWR